MAVDPLRDALRQRRTAALDEARALSQQTSSGPFDTTESSLMQRLYSAKILDDYLELVERVGDGDH